MRSHRFLRFLTAAAACLLGFAFLPTARATVYISGRIVVKDTGAPVDEAPVALYEAPLEKPGPAAGKTHATGTRPAGKSDIAVHMVMTHTTAPVPVVAIEKRAGPTAATPAVTVHTIENGSFILRAPRPGRYRLTVDMKEYLPFEKMLNVPAGGLTSLNLSLLRPPTVTVRLIGPDGQPVTTGKVQLWLLVTGPDLSTPATGAWTTRKVPANGVVDVSTARDVQLHDIGEVGVAVRDADVGYGQAILPRWPDAPVTIHLAAGPVITGIVTDAAGKPQLNTHVALNGMDIDVGQRFLQGWTAAEADAAGKFKLTASAPGRYDLQTSQADAGHTHYHLLTVPAAGADAALTPNDRTGPPSGFVPWGGGPGDSGSVHFYIYRKLTEPPPANPVMITGKVTINKGGKPAPGIPVSVAAGRNYQNGAQEFPTDVATSKEDGSYSLEVPVPGDYRLATPFDYDSEYNPVYRPITVPPAGLPDTDLVLVPKPTLRLRLIDADGKPVTKGTPDIAFQVASQSMGGWSSNTNANIQADGITPVRLYQNIDASSVTSVTLAIHLKGVGAARVHLDQWPTDAVTVKLERGHNVTGRVVDSAGKPVANAQVYAHVFSDDGPYPTFQSMGQTNTDGDGKFELSGLIDGAYLIAAMSTGMATHSVMYRVSAQQNAPVTIPLGAGTIFTGTVVDANGKPVAGVRVNLFRINDQYDYPNTESQEDGGTTNAAGEFTIAGLPAGHYIILVSSPGVGHASHFLTITEGKSQRAVLRMAPVHTLTIRVVDAAGKPVDGAAVNAYQVSGNSQWPNLQGLNIQPNANGLGAFVYRGLQSGIYLITATVPGSKPRLRTIQVGDKDDELVIKPD